MHDAKYLHHLPLLVLCRFRTTPIPMPAFTTSHLPSLLSAAHEAVQVIFRDISQVARVRTCQLLVGQEVTRQAPWHALLFLPLWLELLGMTSARAANMVRSSNGLFHWQ